MSRRTLTMVMAGAALLLVAAAPTREPALSPVQPELLGIAGSLSNAWADFDNDGDLDLFATDRAGPNRLYRNDGGKFVQAFVGVGPTESRSTVGACWLDYDKDGDLDLFLANQSGKILFQQRLFANENPQRISVDANGYASPSPCIEAGRVYVHFGTFGTACLDTKTFRTLWTTRADVEKNLEATTPY